MLLQIIKVSKVTIVRFQTNFYPSIMQSVVGTSVLRELSVRSTADIPNVLSMFGNVETTSHETKKAFSGKGPSLLKSYIYMYVMELGV